MNLVTPGSWEVHIRTLRDADPERLAHLVAAAAMLFPWPRRPLTPKGIWEEATELGERIVDTMRERIDMWRSLRSGDGAEPAPEKITIYAYAPEVRFQVFPWPGEYAARRMAEAMLDEFYGEDWRDRVDGQPLFEVGLAQGQIAGPCEDPLCATALRGRLTVRLHPELLQMQSSSYAPATGSRRRPSKPSKSAAPRMTAAPAPQP